MTAVPKPWSIQEFVAWEEAQPDRYEFADGITRMMVGGTIGHSLIKINVFRSLDRQLEGKPCRPIVEGPKVLGDEFMAFPDLVVTCTPHRRTETTVRDPVLVVEVLSRSTRSFDLTAKWSSGYRHIPSLRHALFVDQEKVSVDVWSRDGTGWHVETLESLDAVAELPAIGCRLALADVYAETEILPPA